MNQPAQPSYLIACHECDALFKRALLPLGARADCTRCGAELYRNIGNSLDRSLALYTTALVLLIMANVYPFLTMKVGGLAEQTHLFTGALALYQFGMGELGLVVFLTSIVFPLITISGMVYLLVLLKFGFEPPGLGSVYRCVRTLEPWSLVGVFLLGVLISIVKLQDLASVIPGIGLVALVLLLLVYSGARVSFDPEILWQHSYHQQLTVEEVDDSVTLLNCHTCGRLNVDEGNHNCIRCGAALHERILNSIQRTWALLFSASLALIPANIYPIMTVKKLGSGQPDTIVSGVIHLIEGGLWGLALIVLFASIVVPFMKLFTLSFLLWSVQTKSNWRPRDRTMMYRFTEIVGAWSMVDVFLVGLLSGLVSLGFIATVEPGLGASFFGAAVILTMFAAHSFDSRLIWDNRGHENFEVDHLQDQFQDQSRRMMI